MSIRDRIKRRREWKRLRVAVVNGHVGAGIRHGVLQWIKRKMPLVKVMFIVEAGWDPQNTVEQRIKFALGPKWVLFPYAQIGKAMTFVAVKKGRRDRMIDGTNEDINKGGKHARRMTACLWYFHHLRREVALSALHTDPLGAGFENATEPARNRHVRQTSKYVDFHDEQEPNTLNLSGGDSNEQNSRGDVMRINKSLRGSTTAMQFTKIDMVPAHWVAEQSAGPYRLIELFVTKAPWVSVDRWRSWDTRLPGMDHEVLGVWLRVRRPRT